jgi:hypothetical protein
MVKETWAWLVMVLAALTFRFVPRISLGFNVVPKCNLGTR